MKLKYLSGSNFEHHLQHSQQKKKRTKRILLASLTLTSMVDMFSLLVIFLLQNYASTGELLFLNKNIDLPEATVGQAVEDAVLVAVSDKEVTIDQKNMGTYKTVAENPLILLSELKKLLAKDGKINLQADKNLESTKVSYVMGVIQKAGFHDFRITVTPGGF